MQKEIIKVSNILSLATCPLKMYLDNNIIGHGTGFFYAHNGKNYLITAGHNITGKDPNSDTIYAIPDKLGIVMHNLIENKYVGGTKEHFVNLQKNDKPVWMVHPKHDRKIDVVAIPFDVSQEAYIAPINNSKEFDDSVSIIAVGMDVFTLGYPHNYSAFPTIFPIWKRGTLATEPIINIDNMPKMYIDTATAKGMSGAPVIAHFNGTYMPNGKLEDNSFFGVARQFLGVYTGRHTDEITKDLKYDLFNAQLGIAWKKSVIEEIILQKIK